MLDGVYAQEQEVVECVSCVPREVDDTSEVDAVLVLLSLLADRVGCLHALQQGVTWVATHIAATLLHGLLHTLLQRCTWVKVQ
jgi:hypothetical protein